MDVIITGHATCVLTTKVQLFAYKVTLLLKRKKCLNTDSFTVKPYNFENSNR